MHLSGIFSSASSPKTRYYFQEKTDEELQPLSLMEQGGLVCTSSSNYFKPAPESRVSTHFNGFLKSKVFLDLFSELPPELIGIIHDFLSQTQKSDELWRHAFERGFLFNHLNHDNQYLKAIVHAVSSTPYSTTSWESLIKIIEKINEHERDRVSLQKFYTALEMIFFDKDFIHIKQKIFDIKAKYFIGNVYAPIAAIFGIGLLGIYFAYLSFYKSGTSGTSLWLRILTFYCGAGSTLIALCSYLYGFYILSTKTGAFARFSIEQNFMNIPHKEIDLFSIDLTPYHAKAMKTAIIHLLESVPLEKQEELNQFLSRFPFWRVD